MMGAERDAEAALQILSQQLPGDGSVVCCNVESSQSRAYRWQNHAKPKFHLLDFVR